LESVLLKGAIVEDVRTGFEKMGDISVIIPEFDLIIDVNLVLVPFSIL